MGLALTSRKRGRDAPCTPGGLRQRIDEKLLSHIALSACPAAPETEPEPDETCQLSKQPLFALLSGPSWD